MNIKRGAALAALALLPFSGTALAQDAASGNGNDDLRREIEAQKQRLAVLERKLEIQQEAAIAAAARAQKEHFVTAACSIRFTRLEIPFFRVNQS